MYIKEVDIGNDYLKIESDYKQTFQNKFTLNIGQKEIVKMKHNDIITDRDLVIAKFLFKFTFATAKQIYRLLNEDINKSNIKNRLDKLVKYRILNKFMLGVTESDEIASDALEIYCLDLGGRYLLANYSNEDTSDWFSIINMKSSQNISKNLLATEFYLRLKETCEEKIVYFKLLPELRVNKKNVIPSFELCMNIGGVNKYFLGEIVRDDEIPNLFRNRVEKLESLLDTQAWKKYFYDVDSFPSLFVFTDNDQLAIHCAKMLSATFDRDDAKNKVQFRLSTQARIQKTLYEKGSFLRYIPAKLAFQETKASTFKPN